MIMDDKEKRDNNQEEHEFCLRCGRKLKNPDFRKIGYGSICLKKLNHKQIPKKLF